MSVHQQLLDDFVAGIDVVQVAVEAAGWDARQAPGEWTVRQVVHHLADAEVVRAGRLYRLLAEDEPQIPGFDEAEYARRLHYERDPAVSLALFRAVRTSIASVLGVLSGEEWLRAGVHAEEGAFGVITLIERGRDHAHDHAAQIRRALET